jgi:predicted amidohydrolase
MRLNPIGPAIVLGVCASLVATAAGQQPAPGKAKPQGDPSAANSPKTLRVAAVQMRSSRNLAENIHKARKHIEDCARDGVRVVVFPECALSGYFDDAHMKGLTYEQLASAEEQVAVACRTHGVYAVVGMPWRDGEKLYNSAVVINPAGKVIERYHKIQLAEAWPDGGDHLSVFPVDGVPASIIVCHDERYPELVRLPVLAGARLVFYVSHESGIKSETKVAPYRAQIQARAVENTVYVVQANAPANLDTSGSHGHSRIIAPDGNLIAEATVFGEDVVRATLDLDKATGRMAEGSIRRGPLGAWWTEGIKNVRIIDDPPAADRDAAK